MSYTVKFRDSVEIAVDSIDEAVELAERLAKTSTNGHRSAATSTKRSNQPKIKDFVAGLKEDPKRGLRAVAANGGIMTAEALCKALNIDSTMSLAGRVVSPIMRNAKKSGLAPSSVFRSQRKFNSDGSKTIEYVIPGDAVEEIQKGLKM